MCCVLCAVAGPLVAVVTTVSLLVCGCCCCITVALHRRQQRLIASGHPDTASSVAATTLLVVTQNYTPECYWWEAVLAGQRLSLSLLFTFVESPVVRMVLLASVCVVCLVLHLIYHPISRPPVFTLQTTLLSCVTLIAFLNLPNADQLVGSWLARCNAYFHRRLQCCFIG